ncbi:putative membrane protein [Corynebacterium glyciniphilum AJ 3170]|uniref:Putative membrane protein n=1 Tax=Corynebacterium glyciniphilum AJ 3170 TaxID=1404245 RepID=X5DY19_9CORY|nr:CPBP family intramembrane glutamic endopeptidase [Corynebacterium glyciniphilum]AHW65492.1 putative membrane protein [Corynebacterium glyciniphilum AJ 3170]
MKRSDQRALRWELVIVLAVTFGASGVRSALRLLEAATMPEDLNEQSTTLNARQSTLTWLDPAFQLVSTGVLVAWGGLALFLLLRHVPPALSGVPGSSFRPRWRDALPGAGLAALIGIPGLAFYVGAVQLGLSKEVIPTGLDRSIQDLLLLILNSWANGFAEEILVVAWLCCRLRQLRVPWVWIFLASAVLRGSYHLYQGYSAGLGNMVMGLVFVWFFYRTGRVWPLIIAHGVIDTVAFVGYQILGSTPGL